MMPRQSGQLTIKEVDNVELAMIQFIQDLELQNIQSISYIMSRQR